MSKRLVLIFLALGILLSGCGGGGSPAASNSPPVAPPPNQAPTANAGEDQIVDEGTAVNLSGTGTDTDGTISSFSWQQDSGTAVTITGDDTANASFTAPLALAAR